MKRTPLSRVFHSVRASAVAVSVFVLLVRSVPSVGQVQPPTEVEIDAWVEQAMRRWDVPGMGLAIIVDGESWIAKGYGLRQIGRPESVDGNTLFSIGSCSKAFGAAAVANLVQDGRLAWDDQIVEHLPWFRLWDPWTTQELRVKDILVHRVGTPSTQWLRPISRDRRDYLSRLQYGTPQHRFRDQFGYTNDMFILSGELVETVSGLRWNEYARQKLWEPLGMTATTALIGEANREPNHAQPHAFKQRRYTGSYATAGPELEPVPWQYVDDLMVPSGGIISSANDMTKWLRFHLGAAEGPLPEEMVEVMHAPHTAIQRPPSWMTFEGGGAYAMGWATGHLVGQRTVGHAGAALGFNCSIAMVPDKSFAVWSTVNRNSELPFVLSKWLVTRFFGRLEDQAEDWHLIHEAMIQRRNEAAQRAERARVAARLNADMSLALDVYTGVFQNDFAGDLEIRLIEGRLPYLPSPAEGRARRWDATPGINELPEQSTAANGAVSSDRRLVAVLGGRERPILIELEHWHVDQFDGWYGDIRIRFSFDVDDMARVSGVKVDYYGDFKRKLDR